MDADRELLAGEGGGPRRVREGGGVRSADPLDSSAGESDSENGCGGGTRPGLPEEGSPDPAALDDGTSLSGESGEEWLSGVLSDAMGRAHAAETERQRAIQRLLLPSVELGVAAVQQLVELLEPAETPLEALQRLGSTARRRRRGQQGSPEDAARQRYAAAITDACEAAERLGVADGAYDLLREELMRMLGARGSRKRRGSAAGALAEQRGGALAERREWVFRWLGQESRAWLGPFTAREMAHWKEHYFGNGVEVRRESEPESAARAVASVAAFQD